MPRVSLAFFLTGALCGLCGMLWGMQMGMSGDHAMHPAHAHLNLLGWVTLSIMGGFYTLAGDMASNKLAWANYILSALGVIVIIPMLYKLLGGDEAIGPMMLYPELLIVGGMLCFIASVIMVWRKSA